MEPEAAMGDQADAAVQALEAPVGEAEADGGEDALAVAADRAGELDERLELRSRRPGQPGVEMRRRELRVLELVEQPQLLLQQERAVERLVGLLDLCQDGELLDRLLAPAPSRATSACP